MAALPELLDELGRRWELTFEPCFPALEINYVAPAVRRDGTRCVLKLSRFVTELCNEIAALRIWAGDGAVRLLEADEALGALLTERVEPGTMLVGLADQDDDAATRITAGLLRHLWRPAPANSGLRPLDNWCAAYERNRAALSAGANGFPAHLFRCADALRAELLASTESVFVLHGDMHHYNVLRSGDDWLAIDPKGLAGDRCFDLCQFLRNPIGGVPARVNSRRLDMFAAELGLDRRRVKDWAVVHTVLDACWAFEDGNSWRAGVEYAEQTRAF